MPFASSLVVALLLALPNTLAKTTTTKPHCTGAEITEYFPLSTYAAALSYCSASYPVIRTAQPTTTTVTTVSTQPGKRGVAKATGNPADSKLFSRLQTHGSSAQSTICSCIEAPTTTTSITTTTVTNIAPICTLPSDVFITPGGCQQPCSLNGQINTDGNCKSYDDYTNNGAIWCDFPGTYLPNNNEDIVSLGTFSSISDCIETCLTSNTVFQCAIVMMQSSTGECYYQNSNYCQYGYCSDPDWLTSMNRTPYCPTWNN